MGETSIRADNTQGHCREALHQVLTMFLHRARREELPRVVYNGR